MKKQIEIKPPREIPRESLPDFVRGLFAPGEAVRLLHIDNDRAVIQFNDRIFIQDKEQ